MSPSTALFGQKLAPARSIRAANGNQLEQLLHEALGRVAALTDPHARACIDDCLQRLLALYGDALARILEIAEPEQKVFAQLIEDRLLTGLLLIHGLHPIDLESRLRNALEKVRPYMQSHGGDVELVFLDHDAAKLRLQGTCHGCPSSAITMELAIRKAIEEACPDLLSLEVEGVSDSLKVRPSPASREPELTCGFEAAGPGKDNSSTHG